VETRDVIARAGGRAAAAGKRDRDGRL